MDADSIAHPVRGPFAAGTVGGDDKGFMSGSVQMINNPQYRIGDTVDTGKKGLGDYGNTHDPTMRAARVTKVAGRDMSADESESIADQRFDDDDSFSGMIAALHSAFTGVPYCPCSKPTTQPKGFLLHPTQGHDVDRDLDALDGAPAFSFRRMWVTLAVAAAIIATGSLAVRMFPNSGYQAGHDAVLDRGTSWVHGEVDAAQSALAACDALYRDTEASEASPRYDYESFVDGCDDAVDQVMGRDVPLVPTDR